MALETNLGLKAERLNVDIASQSIVSAQVGVPAAGDRGLHAATPPQRQPTDFTQGSSDISSRQHGRHGARSISCCPGSAAAITSVERPAATRTIGGTSTFNPQLGSTLNFNVTQPLWRNFKIDQARGGVLSTRSQPADRRRQPAAARRLARSAGAQGVLELRRRDRGPGSRAAEHGHRAGVAASRTRARRRRRRRAHRSDSGTRRVAASFEEQLIDATSLISTTEDNLRALILDHDRPDYWDVKIEPTDRRSSLTEHAVDVERRRSRTRSPTVSTRRSCASRCKSRISI